MSLNVFKYIVVCLFMCCVIFSKLYIYTFHMSHIWAIKIHTYDMKIVCYNNNTSVSLALLCMLICIYDFIVVFSVKRNVNYIETRTQIIPFIYHLGLAEAFTC